jgi:hypothetical protein
MSHHNHPKDAPQSHEPDRQHEDPQPRTDKSEHTHARAKRT